MARDRRVDHEAAMLRVLGERATEDRVVAIGLRDRGFEIVHRDASRDTAEEFPRVLQAGDEVRERLRAADVHVLVAAVDERDDQRVQRVSLPALGIGHQAQATEVDLGELAGGDRSDAHGDAPLVVKPALRDGEPVQRAVRDPDPLARQHLVHLRQPQPPAARVGCEPCANPIAVQRELHFALAGRTAHRDRLHALGDLPSQRLVGLRLLRLPAQLNRTRHPAADRRAAVPGRALDGALAIPAVLAPQHLQDLPHRDLPVRYSSPPFGAGAWTSRALGWDQGREKTTT